MAGCVRYSPQVPGPSPSLYHQLPWDVGLPGRPPCSLHQVAAAPLLSSAVHLGGAPSVVQFSRPRELVAAGSRLKPIVWVGPIPVPVPVPGSLSATQAGPQGPGVVPLASEHSGSDARGTRGAARARFRLSVGTDTHTPSRSCPQKAWLHVPASFPPLPRLSPGTRAHTPTRMHSTRAHALATRTSA